MLTTATVGIVHLSRDYLLRHCGRCHICGTRIIHVLDGEEWCGHCQQYQRPHRHGWAYEYHDLSHCWSEVSA